MKIELRHVSLPPITLPEHLPAIPERAYIDRCQELYRRAGCDWIGVYGDREHSANLLFLTGFDPRFEEALLLLGPDDQRLLFVGNEGIVHATIAGLPLDVRLYQPFSLMAQPRGESLPLADLLTSVGVSRGHHIGLAGWKYFGAHETEVPDPRRPAYIPAWLLSVFDGVTGVAALDVTSVLINPVDGLRSVVSAAEIIRAEWGAARASAAVLRVLDNARPGQTELAAMSAAGFAGEPLSCHPILASSDHLLNGLRSPTARVLANGDAVTCGIGFRGGLCCRAGLLTDAIDETFLADIVAPYFRAIATWWSTIAVGLSGGELYDQILVALDGASFRPMLNPGHLTSSDEWVHSPVRAGSTDLLRSGMILQCDIIPTPLAPGRALNCEDTVALADPSLRDTIAEADPALWQRIQNRRTFLVETLGIPVSDDVLPLSVAPAWLPPFWLNPDLVCTVANES